MINVVLLGLVSFFADIATEMVYPLIPLYLTSVFGATPVLVGIIEGIAESVASLLRVFSGYLSDRFGKKKTLAFFGYSTGVLYKIVLILSASWSGVLIARVIDRFGKGIRTAPRDVMVAESAESTHKGKAYGLHQALDMLGSSLGILSSYFLLKGFTENQTTDYHTIFLISIIPSILSLMMFFFVKEKKHVKRAITGDNGEKREKFWKNIKLLDSNLKLYLFVALIFTLGNSSNTFLLLRAKSVGFNDMTVILAYFVYNIVASIFCFPLGKLSDKVGKKFLLVTGYILFSIVYFGFAFATHKSVIVFAFALYGIFIALTKGIERALIAEIAPAHLKGTMLGLHGTIVGVALLPASAVAGLLWNSFGAPAPFIYGGVLSIVSAIILGLFLKENKSPEVI